MQSVIHYLKKRMAMEHLKLIKSGGWGGVVQYFNLRKTVYAMSKEKRRGVAMCF